MTANGTSRVAWANVTRQLSELKPWSDNPRFSTKAQAQRLLDSWKALGQFATIAIGPPEEGAALYPVYDGHQRLSALLTLYGPEYAIDARQASRPLTDAEHRQLVIAANLAAGQWDWNKLAAWPAPELTAWGMDGEQLQAWNNDANNLKEMLRAEQPQADAEPQMDRAEELREKWGVETSQLWRIGEHRLLCGDSTRREDVERVMGGEKAGGVVTDPPYGIGESDRRPIIEIAYQRVGRRGRRVIVNIDILERPNGAARS